MSEPCNCLGGTRSNDEQFRTTCEANVFALKMLYCKERAMMHWSLCQALESHGTNELFRRLGHDDGDVRTLLDKLAKYGLR